MLSMTVCDFSSGINAEQRPFSRHTNTMEVGSLLRKARGNRGALAAQTMFETTQSGPYIIVM